MQVYEQLVGNGLLGTGLFRRRDRYYEFSDLADLEAEGHYLTRQYHHGGHYEGGFIHGLRVKNVLERSVETALLELSDTGGRTIAVHTGSTWPPGEGRGLAAPMFEPPTQGYETSLKAEVGEAIDIMFPLLELKRYLGQTAYLTSYLHLEGIWPGSKSPYKEALSSKESVSRVLA